MGKSLSSHDFLSFPKLPQGAKPPPAGSGIFVGAPMEAKSPTIATIYMAWILLNTAQIKLAMI